MFARLACGVDPGTGAIRVRGIVDREPVVVVGRACSVAARSGSTYRRAAADIGISADGGALRAVGMGRAARAATVLAAAGAALGVAMAAAVLLALPRLSMRGPRIEWTIPEDDGVHLPMALWLPLIAPWERERAIAEVERHVERQLVRARNPLHVGEIAIALRGLTRPDCERERRVAEQFPGLVREHGFDGCEEAVAQHLAASIASPSRLDRGARRRTLATAIDRRGLALRLLGSGVDLDTTAGRAEVAESLADLRFRSRDVRVYVAQLLRRVASAEAARGRTMEADDLAAGAAVLEQAEHGRTARARIARAMAILRTDWTE
jgi:hypothetical protein